MNYIENDGHITKEYDVKINDSKLEQIIMELDNKCSFLVNKVVKVLAHDKNEAIMKVTANNEEIKVNRVSVVSSKNVVLNDIGECPYVFECEYLSKQSSYLASLLRVILFNYRSSLDFKKQNSGLIDRLIDYQNNEELMCFEERIRKYKSELLDIYHERGKRNDLEYQTQMEDKLSKTILLMQNNENYDFKLLARLYEESKKCFEFILTKETIHYKDINNNPKVYKLGTKKLIY